MITEMSQKYIDQGLITGMPNEMYHSIRGFVSSSGLRYFEESPLHYQAYLRSEKKQTDDQLLGTLFHMLVLEPELFDQMYICVPGDRRNKEVKDAVAAAEATGRTVVKTEMYDTVKKMAEKTLAKIKRMGLFTPSGLSEASVFVVDPATDCPIKARFDRIEPELGVVYDFKSYSSASEYSFRPQLFRMRYDRQAALYLRAASIHFGKPFTDFVNIVCETSDPWEPNCLRVDDPTIDRATERLYGLLERFKQCLDTDTWPGFEDRIQSINVNIL